MNHTNSMKYTKLFADDVTSETNGTHFLGTITTTYDTLDSVLWEPTFGKSADGKVNCEWVIVFDDGLVATIYDWKNNETPRGLHDWHIGGHNAEVVGRIREMFSTVLAD